MLLVTGKKKKKKAHLGLLNMRLLIVTAALFLMSSLPAEEATRILHIEEQNLMSQNQFLESKQGQVSPSVPNKITGADIPSSTFSQKAFENGHNLSPLLRRLLRADYIIPALTTSHSASPLLGSLQKSPPEPPFMPKRGNSIPLAWPFWTTKASTECF